MSEQELKQRFFAQYFGQYVYIFHDGKGYSSFKKHRKHYG